MLFEFSTLCNIVSILRESFFNYVSIKKYGFFLNVNVFELLLDL